MLPEQMGLTNKDVLKALFPVKLGGVLDGDLAIDGAILDAAQTSFESLVQEMFPDTANLLLPCWERVLGITPPAGATLQSRRIAATAMVAATPGDIKQPYFVALAAKMGYTVTIDSLTPFMAGWGRAGDPLYIADAIYIWIVTVANQPLFQFRSGQSAAGEPLSWWSEPGGLQTILNDLKPADVYLAFTVEAGTYVPFAGQI